MSELTGGVGCLWRQFRASSRKETAPSVLGSVAVQLATSTALTSGCNLCEPLAESYNGLLCVASLLPHFHSKWISEAFFSSMLRTSEGLSLTPPVEAQEVT